MNTETKTFIKVDLTNSEFEISGDVEFVEQHLQELKEFIKIGFNIGIDGPITFKNNKKQREMVKNIDINHILVETDSPYLSPEPNRGKVNTSLNLVYILKQIASELDMEYEEIKEITTNNARNLFKI